MSESRPHFDSPPRVFISYARADGEDFATRLRRRLEAEEPEITLWQDRARMEGGVGWWKQITEALDRVEFLLMVMTPAAMRSEVARKEWRYARQQGVRICPVLGAGAQALDFAALPSWMRKAHCYDLAREWETFVAFLKSARRESRVPFMAPDLRADFVPRPEHFDALLAQLLDRGREDPVAITTALQGSGGFGKTTLAVALCHDEDVMTAYDDGILWATLGESPNIQHELTKLYAALTGERPPFVDAEDAAIQLAERLGDRNCLIVIDDVWDPNHVKPFLRGGRQCARLITTRRLPVVTETGAHRVFVNEMTEGQSVALIAARLPVSTAEAEPLRALARRLGEWPLLLKLTASQLRERIERGDSLEGALAYVNRALDKRGAVAFDRADASARNDAVAKTVAASLDLLGPEDRVRCAELSIFPEDKWIPASAAGALWGTDEFDTEELLQQLDGAALIDFDLKSGCIRLHDVLQAFLFKQLKDPAAVHARLIRQGWGDHHALPDAFAWRWIGWHLDRAGESARLASLLLDFDWLRAKLEATDIQAVVQDFDFAPPSPALTRVRDALRLASNALTVAPEQLAAQLCGRFERGRLPEVDRVVEQARSRVKRPWLALAHPTLTHPSGPLIAILKGHAAAAECLAMLSSGSDALSGSADGTLRLWDLATGSVVRVLEGHEGTVHSVAVSPDGKRAVSGSEDRTVRVWDLASGRAEAILRGHYGAVLGVAIDPPGRRAVSISEDGTLRIWDLGDGTPIGTIKGYSHQACGLAISPDGRFAAFGAGDWSAALVDLASGQTERVLERHTTPEDLAARPGRRAVDGHTGMVRAIAFMPDGERLLTGSDDGTLRLWDRRTGAPLRVLEGHRDGVLAITVSTDGRLAVSASRDHTLRIWDMSTGAQLGALHGHSGWVTGVAVATDGRRALSASADRTLRLWRLDAPAGRDDSDALGEPVALLAISANGRKALAARRGGALHVWDAEAGRVEGIRGAGPDGHDEFLTLRAATDGDMAIAVSRDRTLRVLDLGTTRTVSVLTGLLHPVRRIEMSAGAMRAVALSRDRVVRVWDLDSGRVCRQLVGPETAGEAHARRLAGNVLLAELGMEPVVDIAGRPIGLDSEIAITPDARRVLIGSAHSLCEWDMEAGSTRYEELGDFDVVEITTHAPAGLALVGSRFGPARVIRLGDLRTLRVLEGHTARIFDAAIVGDGSRAVTAARDDTIRVWDLAGGRELARIEGAGGNVDTVAIAPDGAYAYAVYGDTLVASDVGRRERAGSVSLDYRITSLSVAADGRRLAVGDESGRVHFLRLEA